MSFEEIVLSKLEDPVPSYEWTRSRLVDAINDYIRASLQENLNIARLGVTGMIEFPPASPVPYAYLPDSGPSCGGIVGFTPGMVNDNDYDTAAAKCRNGNGSFWANYFELVGTAIYRTTLIISPYLTAALNYPSNSGFSTPMPYSLSGAPNISYKLIGNVHVMKRALEDWRKRGDSVFETMKSGTYRDKRSVWSLVSREIVRASNNFSYMWYQYNGEIRRDSDAYPGSFTGYIYGNLQFK